MFKQKREKVLVLGGAGLIGSFLVEKLVKERFDVCVLDDLSKGQLRNLKSVKDKIKILKLNLEKNAKLKNIFSEYSNIFHLASRAYGVGYSKGNHSKIYKHNLMITNNIIKSMKGAKIKYLQCVSSSCVYRDTGPDKISEKLKLYGKPEKANLGYGKAKRYLEKKMIEASNKYRIPISIVRPFNIYGERYKWVGSASQAIPMLVNKVIKSKDKIEIWGSGKQKRNYIHAKDCAEIMYKIFKKKYVKTPINIGYENTISLTDLVKQICKLSNKKPMLIYNLKKPQGRFIKSSNSSLLKKVTNNYKTKITLSKGLKLMIKWHKKTF